VRDRVLEFLPLLLVVVLLAGYQAVRAGGVEGPLALIAALKTPVPTPTVAVASVRAVAVNGTSTPTSSSASFSSSSANGCAGGQPRFLGGLALLRAAVGARMGDPLECEHAVDGQGDTQQRTSTGLAYYRKARNAPTFTTGYDHWALAPDGSLIHWTGDAVDAPE
jgi:hypothetical protein